MATTQLPDATRIIFSPDGPLSHADWYEDRPQQTSMACSVAAALANRRHLIVEAPTGVGKTLAYLIPALLYTSQTGRKAIVSTYTKNLQDQILKNDVPIARSVLDRDCSVLVLKGRRNYLCPTRLEYALSTAKTLFDAEGAKQLTALNRWSRTTREGDLETVGFALRPDIWDMVCSDKEVCTSQYCGQRCFYRRQRELLRGAQLVVMNHALFFTLLGLQETSDHYLFEDDFVIFDEAHMVEAVASRGLGATLSRYRVLSAIHRIWNPRTRKGLLANERRSVKHLCGTAERAAGEFFDTLLQLVTIHSSSRRDNNTLAQTPREFRLRMLSPVPNVLDGPLTQLLQEVHRNSEKLESDQQRVELSAAQRVLEEIRIRAQDFLSPEREGFVHWLELAGVTGENVTLHAAPVEIADVIGPILFREGTSAIMTSATLAVHGDLAYFQSRLGAQQVDALVLDSPFDHMRRMTLRIAADIPEPDTEEYADALPSWIVRCIEDSGGRALVLFTSAALMRTVTSRLADELASKDFPLLVQGEQMSRSELLDEFKRDTRTVLFGLDSFWMGVDVPGEALEHVIITRLPFAVPSHPLMEARIETISSRGGNAFVEYTLPEAVLKFRQGVGRLLRTTSDKGLVTVLDCRLITRRYGRIFLSSISRCPIEILRRAGDDEPLSLNET